MIKQEWLACWNDHLSHPDVTPHQVICLYVEQLNITVARLDDKMDWDIWDDNKYPAIINNAADILLGYGPSQCLDLDHITTFGNPAVMTTCSPSPWTSHQTIIPDLPNASEACAAVVPPLAPPPPEPPQPSFDHCPPGCLLENLL